MQNVTVVDPDSNSTVLTNLIPGTTYMVRVAGNSVRGVGNFSDFASGQTYEGMCD